MSALNIFIPITKIDTEKRMVYGTLTEEIPDKSGEIFDYATGKEAFIKWSNDALERSQGKSKGNIRAMHGKVAAGKLTELHFDDDAKKVDGGTYIGDDQEWQKCLDGIYTGFSIGGDYAKRWVDTENNNLTRYTPVIAEVSLVDNPCVSTATFSVVKADGSVEQRAFKSTQTEITNMDAELPQNSTEAKQVWQAADGSTHATKAEAVAKSTDVKNQETVKPLLDAMAALGDVVKAKTSTGNGELLDDQDLPEAEKVKTGDEDEKAKADSENANDSSDEKGKKDKKPAKFFAPKMQKGMDSIARAACLIQELDWLQSCIEYEADYENDGSPQPQKLDGIIAQLCSFLKDLVEEETGEMVAAGMGDTEKSLHSLGLEKATTVMKFSSKLSGVQLPDDLEKRGARNSKTDTEMMAKAHEHASEIQKCMKSMGYDDGSDDKNADKAITGQMEKLSSENAVLSKAVADSTDLLKQMAEQIQTIAAQPAPRKGVLKSVSKTDDVVAPAQNQTVTDPKDTLSLIKQVHQNPVRF